MNPRGRFTYANVVSTLCLFLLLGGVAYGAAKVVLPKNSVGARQLKKGAVTGAKVKDGSLTGADINVATLGQVPSAQRAVTAASADTATTARSADTATTATTATSATTATRAGGAPPTGPAGGSLTGTYPQPKIAAGAVETEGLRDAAVTTAKLAAGAVRGSNLGRVTEVTDQFSGTGIVHSAGSVNELGVQCPTGSRVISGGFQAGYIYGFNPAGSHMSGNGWVVSGYVPGSTDVSVQVMAYCLE